METYFVLKTPYFMMKLIKGRDVKFEIKISNGLIQNTVSIILNRECSSDSWSIKSTVPIFLEHPHKECNSKNGYLSK